jgi:hypothetical protein
MSCSSQGEEAVSSHGKDSASSGQHPDTIPEESSQGLAPGCGMAEE